jgi:apolipoprotein N-acyltransferase
VVRAANTGISGFIDATGKIVESLAPFEEGILLYRVNIINTETFYCRYGDLFAKLCFLGLFFVFFPTWRPRLKFFG